MTLWRVKLVGMHYSVWVCLIFHILFISCGVRLLRGAVDQGLPISFCLTHQLCLPGFFWTCHLRLEANLYPELCEVPGGEEGLRGGELRGNSSVLYFLHPLPPSPTSKHLDHWLTFSPALKVLFRDWISFWVWLSSLFCFSLRMVRELLCCAGEVKTPGRRSQLLGGRSS